MIFAKKQLLHQIFEQELFAIQEKHKEYFTDDQMELITVVKSSKGFELKFLEGYHLDAIITSEIKEVFGNCVYKF